MLFRRSEHGKDQFASEDSREKSKRFKIRQSTSFRGVRIYWRYLSILLIGWILLIQYYERTVVKRAMNKCRWENWEGWKENEESFRVGLFADPQIMDAYSYPDRPTIVNWFTQQIIDNYHARNWKFFHYYLKPDSVFFLGDLFDGGRNWETDEWIHEFERFNDIFPKKPGQLTVMSLPGNHDIGFGNTIVESSLERFKTFFGDPSSKWTVGNHTFVLLDTISLSDRVDVNISSIPREFMEEFQQSKQEYPTILLTHVPLYRNPQTQQCGKMRESKTPFPLMQGDQYQTVIDADISLEVLQVIKPKIVFSGDDHDFCHIKHEYHIAGESRVADEITVKSCAMNMGVSRPAIELISLHNPDNNENTTTFQTEICYMPDPYKPIFCYCIFLAISIGFLFWMSMFSKSFNRIIAKNIPLKSLEPTSILPITHGNSDETRLASSASARWRVPEQKCLKNFVSNSAILLCSLFIVFSLFYKGY